MQILRACNPHKFSNIRIVMVDEVLLVENKFCGRPVNSYGNLRLLFSLSNLRSFY